MSNILNVIVAQEAFESLEQCRHPEIADDYHAIIRKYLAQEKADASILDRTRRNSAETMENRITEALEKNRIECTRQMFKHLENATSPECAYTLLKYLDRSVKNMRADLSVADRSGKSTSAQIRTRIAEAWENNMQKNPRLKTLYETRREIAMEEMAASKAILTSAVAAPASAHVARQKPAAQPVISAPQSTDTTCPRPRKSRAKWTQEQATRNWLRKRLKASLQ